jgi:hypothetical protein
MIPHTTPPPLQSPLLPSSPAATPLQTHTTSGRSLYLVNGLFRSPQSSPTRSFFDFPQDRDIDAKPAHFRYGSPSSSSASSSFTFIHHADAIGPPDTSSSSLYTCVFLQPARHAYQVRLPWPLTPRSPSPCTPRTPTQYPGLALSPSPYATNNSPLPTTPQSATNTSPFSARIFRSKSLHQPSPPLPPLPASARSGGVRRKRPERCVGIEFGGDLVLGAQMRVQARVLRVGA